MQFLKHTTWKVFLIIFNTTLFSKKRGVTYYKLFEVWSKKIYEVRENYNFHKEFKPFKPNFFKKNYYLLTYYLWAKK